MKLPSERPLSGTLPSGVGVSGSRQVAPVPAFLRPSGVTVAAERDRGLSPG